MMMKVFEPIPPDIEHLAKVVVDAAYSVHSSLGPGLLESVYEICLLHELRKRKIPSEQQVRIPVLYDGLRLEAGLRIDLLVDRKLILEIKAVEEMNRIYKAQVLTYLKLTGLRLGLLINFNVALIKNGIERVIL
jgi:GxxExxY protein